MLLVHHATQAAKTSIEIVIRPQHQKRASSTWQGRGLNATGVLVSLALIQFCSEQRLRMWPPFSDNSWNTSLPLAMSRAGNVDHVRRTRKGQFLHTRLLQLIKSCRVHPLQSTDAYHLIAPDAATRHATLTHRHEKSLMEHHDNTTARQVAERLPCMRAHTGLDNSHART